jgi:hypothetical protein
MLAGQAGNQRLHGDEPAGRQHADAGDVAGRRRRKTAVTLTLGGASGSGGGIFGGGFFSSGTPAAQGEAKLFEKEGVWSFFRLLDAGSVLKQGDNVG